MVLAYIQGLGKNYKSENEYEFIFCESEDDVIQGEEWNRQRAVDYGVTPPSVDCVTGISRIVIDPEDIDLELVQEIDGFTVLDAVDGIVSLGWEVDPPVTHRTKRLVFKYGESFTDVKNKFYTRDIDIELMITDKNKINDGL